MPEPPKTARCMKCKRKKTLDEFPTPTAAFCNPCADLLRHLRETSTARWAEKAIDQARGRGGSGTFFVPKSS
jgi:hypothetical protein